MTKITDFAKFCASRLRLQNVTTESITNQEFTILTSDEQYTWTVTQ